MSLVDRVCDGQQATAHIPKGGTPACIVYHSQQRLDCLPHLQLKTLNTLSPASESSRIISVSVVNA
jgi:hypothetical protein